MRRKKVLTSLVTRRMCLGARIVNCDGLARTQIPRVVAAKAATWSCECVGCLTEKCQNFLETDADCGVRR